MKPTRITVTRGATVTSPDGKAWSKAEYSLEFEVEDLTEVQVVRAEAEGMINAWLAKDVLTTPASAVTEIAADIGELNGLPWKSYQTKDACKPGEAGWIFSNAQGAERLINMLHEAPSAPVVTPSYEYRLSGDKGQFIQRKPVKKA